MSMREEQAEDRELADAADALLTRDLRTALEMGRAAEILEPVFEELDTRYLNDMRHGEGAFEREAAHTRLTVLAEIRREIRVQIERGEHARHLIGD